MYTCLQCESRAADKGWSQDTSPIKRSSYPNNSIINDTVLTAHQENVWPFLSLYLQPCENDWDSVHGGI